ncbi:hypothetical protein CC2G_006711 [Coprinopsis cinerea AmutBmut pab1-1]|nr:hypothetical protein CC2G_006711 [Coprinopsis cinerea AmutBmut pab1-1]
MLWLDLTATSGWLQCRKKSVDYWANPHFALKRILLPAPLSLTDDGFTPSKRMVPLRLVGSSKASNNARAHMPDVMLLSLNKAPSE